MASLEETIQSEVPGGNIGKPLVLALGALLASGALFKGSGTGSSTSSDSQGTTSEGAGGLLGGLGGLLNKLQTGGLGNIASSRVSSGPNQPVPPAQLGTALGTDIIKALSQRTGLPEEELTKQLSQVLPQVVDKLTPAGRLPTMAELSQMK